MRCWAPRRSGSAPRLQRHCCCWRTPGWQWIEQSGDPSTRFLQAALTGTGLFVVALLAHQLALRLAREETMALRSRSTAQLHAQVNDLVIETLSEGVLVIDAEGRVHSANPAADAILGRGLASMALPFELDAHPAWHPLAVLADTTFTRHAPQSQEMPIAQAGAAPREVRVRTRLTPASDRRIDSLCVMFLQDLRELEARIRTEKLAAMGRMSAAVAHEIRNPLAAITQASALLAEDLVDPTHRQLTAMVQQNAQRLARIVDDVLDVSRARQQRSLPTGDMVTLDSTVRTLAEEWVRQTQRQGVLLALDAGARDVRFEVEHLRRILVNLLDMTRHALCTGDRHGSIQVTTAVNRARAAGPRCRSGATAHRSSRRCSGTCSSPSSRPRAAPAAWASSSAASCANATAPPSAMSAGHFPRPGPRATNSSWSLPRPRHG